MKVLLVALMIVMQSIQAFPREFLQPTSYTLYPGSYAKYHYKYGTETYLVVFAYVGNMKFYVTYKGLLDETENGYFLFDYSKDGNLEETVVESVASKKENSRHFVIETLILNMMEIYEKAYTLKYGMFESNRIIDEYYGQNEIYYRFDKWIPIFNFYGIFSNARNEYLVELVDAGIWKDTSKADILYADIIRKIPDPYSYLIEKRDPMPITMNGIDLMLDKNWIFKPKSVSGADSYWIQSKSQRDAMIGAFRRNENIKKQQVLENIARSLLVDNIVPSTIEIHESESEVSEKYEILDSSNGYSTMTRIIYKLKNSSYDILILNVYTSIYESNRDYFESLILK
jgi:hypothetical protein